MADRRFLKRLVHRVPFVTINSIVAKVGGLQSTAPPRAVVWVNSHHLILCRFRSRG
jgi:hypothetical protein